MDDLANELSCTMIDVDGNGERKPTAPASVFPGSGACGGEASAEGDGGSHEQHGGREKLPIKGRDVGTRMPINERKDCMYSPRRARLGSYSKPSSRVTKPVARSASILLRSKVLILSDSESDDGDSSARSAINPGSSSANSSSLNRKKLKKQKRKKSDKPSLVPTNPFALNQCFGKRKRSTTISFSMSGESAGTSGTGDASMTNGKSDTTGMAMECESYEFDSSSLSDSSINSDYDGKHFEEADDEQTDFEGISTLPHTKSARVRHSHGSKPILRNPFALVTANESTPSSSFTSAGSSAALWKRRRRNQWP
jgi:hypothetical protein